MLYGCHNRTCDAPCSWQLKPEGRIDPKCKGCRHKAQTHKAHGLAMTVKTATSWANRWNHDQIEEDEGFSEWGDVHVNPAWNM